MRGRYFGYRPAAPCPECGTERILLDFDDDAYVVPVVWEDVETCDGEIVVTFPVYADGYWERRSADGRSCPKCGGPVKLHSTDIRYGVTHVFVFRCLKPRTSPQYRRVQGCPRCHESYSWHGVGLTAGE